MRRFSLRARAAALLPLAAFGVHRLRYEVVFGGRAEHELAAQGHAYLSSLTPMLALAAALVAAELLARFVAAWRGAGGPERRPPLVVLALAIAASLLVIYTGQELAEGLLATGHPSGLVGVFGSGGWWAAPLALVFGLAIALLLRGADAAIALVARARSGVRPNAAAPDRLPAPRIVFLPPCSPLASAAPGRAPPFGTAST
jgi:hypothetical protein